MNVLLKTHLDNTDNIPKGKPMLETVNEAKKYLI